MKLTYLDKHCRLSCHRSMMSSFKGNLYQQGNNSSTLRITCQVEGKWKTKERSYLERIAKII